MTGVLPPIEPPPASPTRGMRMQTIRVLSIAAGGAAMYALGTSPTWGLAILPAVGVLGVWAYGLWDRYKTNQEKITMHGIIETLLGSGV